jgi:glutamine cyclotransferase
MASSFQSVTFKSSRSNKLRALRWINASGILLNSAWDMYRVFRVDANSSKAVSATVVIGFSWMYNLVMFGGMLPGGIDVIELSSI